MLLSMTGFGKYTESFENQNITVEIKSLNSKFTDLSLKLPQWLRSYELELRKQISDKLVRGKIDVLIQVQKTQAMPCSQINSDVVKSYIEQLQKITPESTPTELLSIAMRMPETVITIEDIEPSQDISQIKKCVENALNQLEQFRIQEGSILKNDLASCIQNIESLLQEVEDIDPFRKASIREKLTKAINDIPDVDFNRFEQELIYYLEKYDISEEKIRLKNHLDYFIQSIENQEFVGKKLGFIAQEIGREINTLGSKANHAHMQKIVVQMKDELEKIKEQVLNVL